MNMKERQAAEALKRMALLNLHPNAVKEFKEEGRLNYSFNAMLYWTSKSHKKVIHEFEEKYEAVVYHVILNHTEFGVLLTLLFVSKYEEEWERDCNDLGNGEVMAYVCNMTDPDMSEFGYVGVKPLMGGVVRTF